MGFRTISEEMKLQIMITLKHTHIYYIQYNLSENLNSIQEHSYITKHWYLKDVEPKVNEDNEIKFYNSSLL